VANNRPHRGQHKKPNITPIGIIWSTHHHRYYIKRQKASRPWASNTCRYKIRHYQATHWISTSLGIQYRL